MRYSLPPKWFMPQRSMLQVCYALVPLLAASVALFGWRALALTALVLVAGMATEAAFAFRQGKPVTAAVLVTCLIYVLSLPPTLPFWMAVVGIIVAVAIGKMAFGGFGRNVFNPAMVGRCFLYVAFPIQMTNVWVVPSTPWPGGFALWSPGVDAVTSATPLAAFKQGASSPLHQLLLGNVAGSLGETSALLIVLGGAYLVYQNILPWRIALACLLGGLAVSSLMQFAASPPVAPPLVTLASGAFLFGAVFIATEPITGSKTHVGQWLYGGMIGSLIVVLRAYSNFPEGVMFSVLIMNGFVPLIDTVVRHLQERKQVAP